MLARSQKCEKRLSAPSCLSVCPPVRPSAWNNSASTEWIFKKIYIWIFFKNMFRKPKFNLNLTLLTGTLQEELSTFMIKSRWILFRIINVSDRSCRKNQIPHFITKTFLRKSWLWDNVEKYCTARKVKNGNIIRRDSLVCRIPMQQRQKTVRVILLL